MKHTDFIYMRRKGGRGVFMFIGSYEDYLKEFSTEDRKDYEDRPISFYELDIDALEELLTCVLEDRNSHRTLYRIKILADVLRESVDEQTAANIMRKYILCLEAHWDYQEEKRE